MNSQLKRSHEFAVAKSLFAAISYPATLLREGNDQGEPDTIFSVDSRSVGVEITAAYYGNEHAKNDWAIARGDTRPIGRVHSVVEPDETICVGVQNALNTKCLKTYRGTDEVWLCIEERAPLSNSASIEACIRKLTVPIPNGFDRIYVLHYPPIGEGDRPIAFPLKWQDSH